MPINGRVLYGGQMRDKEKKKATGRAYYAAHRELCLAKSKAYYQAHKDERIAYHKSYHVTNRHLARNRNLNNAYGISQAAFLELLSKQGDACAICRTSDWGKRGPFVDHDHRTGQVRGVLCFRCNSALGYVNDNPNIIRAMGDYLSNFNGRATDLLDNEPSGAVNAGR
jgi:antirestriction protein ArdC